MKIELTPEQLDLLLSLLSRLAEQYAREAANLMQLKDRCAEVEDLAQEWIEASQGAAELVGLLMECDREEGDHA